MQPPSTLAEQPFFPARIIQIVVFNSCLWFSGLDNPALPGLDISWGNAYGWLDHELASEQAGWRIRQEDIETNSWRQTTSQIIAVSSTDSLPFCRPHRGCISRSHQFSINLQKVMFTLFAVYTIPRLRKDLLPICLLLVLKLHHKKSPICHITVWQGVPGKVYKNIISYRLRLVEWNIQSNIDRKIKTNIDKINREIAIGKQQSIGNARYIASEYIHIDW